MSEANGTNGAGREGYVLRVLRLADGEQCSIRTLSPVYLGTFTHYINRRSVICEGADCHPTLHKTELLWKGYAAVEKWGGDRSVWMPWILEITSNTELDFRDQWQRGQVWELSRPKQTTKKKTTVGAVLVVDQLGEELPEPFDYTPTLQRVFNTRLLYLGQPNPLPPRQIVRPSAGAAPPTRLSMQRERERREQLKDQASYQDVRKILQSRIAGEEPNR